MNASMFEALNNLYCTTSDVSQAPISALHQQKQLRKSNANFVVRKQNKRASKDSVVPDSK